MYYNHTINGSYGHGEIIYYAYIVDVFHVISHQMGNLKPLLIVMSCDDCVNRGSSWTEDVDNIA